MHIDTHQLKGDIFGGITAGIVALPLALAFGAASGLGAAAGLYGAIGVGLLAAIFGGTRTQISGPTGPMTVVSATVIAHFMQNNQPELIYTTFILSGLFLVLMGYLRLGQFVRYIPYPVVSGFMSGIGVIIIFLQVLPFFGQPASPKILEGLSNLGNTLASANLSAVFLGGLTIALIYITPRLQKRVPATLIALLVGTLVSVVFRFDVPTIGEIPNRLPELTWAWIGISDLQLILLPALTLAALAAIDSLLTSVVADKMTQEKHDSNRELVGQGIGNAFAGLIGGIPGAGATMRTVVNINSGGTTRLSGVIHALVLMVILFGLGPYASQIPMAVLAGILITVGISIIDYRGLKDIAVIPRSDAAVKIVVLSMTVFVDLLQAVGIGMVLACIFFVKKMADLLMDYVESHLEEMQLGPYPVLVKRLTGPLYFGYSNALEDLFQRVSQKGAYQAVVLDLREVNFIDQSGWYVLEAIHQRLIAENLFFFVLIHDGPSKTLLDKRGLKEVPFLINLQQVHFWLEEHLPLNNASKENGPQTAQIQREFLSIP